jgi:hypothetical protein
VSSFKAYRILIVEIKVKHTEKEEGIKALFCSQLYVWALVPKSVILRPEGESKI